MATALPSLDMDELNALREVVASAGFGRIRRATETPFNIVYEARP
jgi:hypothetical protein